MKINGRILSPNLNNWEEEGPIHPSDLNLFPGLTKNLATKKFESNFEITSNLDEFAYKEGIHNNCCLGWKRFIPSRYIKLLPSNLIKPKRDTTFFLLTATLTTMLDYESDLNNYPKLGACPLHWFTTCPLLCLYLRNQRDIAMDEQSQVISCL